jgi:4-aminobutyrate aminotransferase-like enzyme
VRYLDAYNHVPVVGHAHPAVAQAVGRQTATLNVNARYLHPNAVELAERLLATMPDGLDTCVFVNSGSEANDLAWRMATCHTGRAGALVTSTSYHGVSAATAALSANTWRAGVRPGHVATMAAPRAAGDVIPGQREASAAVAAACAWLSERSLELALCVVDPMFTSGGILHAGTDYLAGLVDAVHRCGGLFLADEVQAGFGRSGHGMWSFSRFGITPDFVTLGKPMGNGYPVAALITRSDIVRSFTAVDEFFSTFGGTPTAAAAALTVLDIIEQEDLVVRSRRYGDLLRERISRCLAGLPCDVDVRGAGLISGIEFHSRSVDLMPSLVERLRSERILVGSTGPGGRTLKVRPPLIWTDEHIDIFVAGLRNSVVDLLSHQAHS